MNRHRLRYYHRHRSKELEMYFDMVLYPNRVKDFFRQVFHATGISPELFL